MPDGDTVKIPVFVVTDDKEAGYSASSAMSGTRTNEKLENLPNSISVMTEVFLQDLALNNYFDAVNFAMSAENIFNDLGTVGAPPLGRSGSQVNIRGLATVRQLRDGFPWYQVPDVFNTERIEFSRGPGGLAYGDVDAGGIINIATKRATFQRRGEVQVRYDSFGTQRFSFDFNQPLLPGRLGVRLNAISSEIEQYRQRMGRDLTARAGALRWEPFKHRRTQIDVLFEHGHTTNHIGHLGFNDHTRAYVRGTGTIALDANPNLPGIQTNGVGMARIFASNSANNALFEADGVIYSLRSTATEVFRISTLFESADAVSPTDPQNPNRLPQMRVENNLVPDSEDWAGGDNFQKSRYQAYTLEFKHAFSDRLNVLLAHNRQFDTTYRKGSYSALTSFQSAIFGARSVHIDVNPFLPNPAGPGLIPNRNYEQLYTIYNPIFAPEGHTIINWRAQVVYDASLPFGISQRVVAGAGYRHEDNYSDNYNFALAREEIARRGYSGSAAFYTNNFVGVAKYLRNGNSDDALRFDARPGITTFFRNNANLNRRFDQSLTSGAINLLGAYFGGRVRTSVGLSRERWLQSVSTTTRSDPANNNELRYVAANGSLIPNDGTKHLTVPVFPFDDAWSTNQTYGGVWKALPWVSLAAGYFESSQFSDNYGIDLTGAPLSPLTGEGSDVSVRFHLFKDKVQANITRFQTKQENLNSAISTVVRDELNPLLATPLVNLTDYRDLTSSGWEYQVTANASRQWTMLASYSKLETVYTRFFPLLGQLVTEARATAQARRLNPDDATRATADFLEIQEGNVARNKRVTASIATRYTFTSGRLRGLSVGAASRYASGKPRGGISIAGIEVKPRGRTENYIITSPFLSYQRKINRQDWKLQLNVDNVFNEKSDQGNSWRWQRYTDPRKFVTTVTAKF